MAADPQRWPVSRPTRWTTMVLAQRVRKGSDDAVRTLAELFVDVVTAEAALRRDALLARYRDDDPLNAPSTRDLGDLTEDLVSIGNLAVMEALATARRGGQSFIGLVGLRGVIQRAMDRHLHTLETKAEMAPLDLDAVPSDSLADPTVDTEAAALTEVTAERICDEVEASVGAQGKRLQLTRLEAETVLRRYGFVEPELTLTALGARFGVTRERVRQYQTTGRRKLSRAWFSGSGPLLPPVIRPVARPQLPPEANTTDAAAPSLEAADIAEQERRQPVPLAIFTPMTSTTPLGWKGTDVTPRDIHLTLPRRTWLTNLFSWLPVVRRWRAVALDSVIAEHVSAWRKKYGMIGVVVATPNQLFYVPVQYIMDQTLQAEIRRTRSKRTVEVFIVDRDGDITLRYTVHL